MYQWDQLSEKYSLGNHTRKYILIPGLLDNVDESLGKKILDFGCGSGLISLIFQNRGFDVVGVDVSDEMIRLAKNKNPGPRYTVSNALFFRADKKFDQIISNMVVCNLSSKTELDSFFISCYKNLKNKGSLYIADIGSDFPSVKNDGFTKIVYPAKYKDGSKIQVLLKMLDDVWMGPFDNYFWSQDAILKSAKKAGFEKKSIISLKSINGKDKYREKNKYALYIFRKKLKRKW